MQDVNVECYDISAHLQFALGPGYIHGRAWCHGSKRFRPYNNIFIVYVTMFLL